MSLSHIERVHLERVDREYGTMILNDIIGDLQAYVSDLDDSLHASLEREQIAQDRIAELEAELDKAIDAMLIRSNGRS